VKKWNILLVLLLFPAPLPCQAVVPGAMKAASAGRASHNPSPVKRNNPSSPFSLKGEENI